ncbi:MAG: carbohydrate porin [Planctomycetota bacterium]
MPLSLLPLAALWLGALPQDGPRDPSPPAATTSGILPVRTHGGSLVERSFLTGDWGGARDRWSESGIRFDIAWTQTVQSVLDGGLDETTEYGGRLDSLITFDLDRMGAVRGGLLDVRAESRYGESVNSASGALLPVNDVMFFPLGAADEDILVNVTELRYTQFLSSAAAVFFGKIVILGGDYNEFAGGRGDTQFMGHTFLSATVTALINPYSSLGAGGFWKPTKNSTLTTAVYGSQDASSTAGFEELENGLTWNTAYRTQYELGGLPGGYNVAFQYAFNGDFTEIDGQFVDPEGRLRRPTESESWNVYANLWQYLSVAPGSDAAIDVTNSRIDRAGYGFFLRAGVADRDTNPVEWVVSGGIGGRGVVPGRDEDSVGIGLATGRAVENRFTDTTLVDRSTGRFEAYYAYAITPSTILTLNFQYIDTVVGGRDPATLLGLRLRAAL